MAAIERDAFSDPWPERDFRDCVTAGVPFLVATVDRSVAGYLVARHAADEGEILNLGVERGRRGQGIGRALVRAVLRDLHGRGAAAVYLEVRASNAAARQLYDRLGFHEVGRRKGYYHRPPEDAIILRAAISTAS
ncbi:MAG: ribosomal protein S18-alanine N-acetyltransferase [Gemmatimonadales bacterium]